MRIPLTKGQAPRLTRVIYFDKFGVVSGRGSQASAATVVSLEIA